MNAKDLLSLLPAVLKFAESALRAGDDPKEMLERISAGYDSRARIEAEVAAAARGELKR